MNKLLTKFSSISLSINIVSTLVLKTTHLNLKKDDKKRQLLKIVRFAQLNYEYWLGVIPQIPSIEENKNSKYLTMLYLQENKKPEKILNFQDTFLNFYKYIEYNWNTNYDTSQKDRFDYSINQIKLNLRNKKNKYINHTKLNYPEINLNQNIIINIFNLTYKNVSLQKNFGILVAKWQNNFKMKLELSVNTRVLVLAWNAYWARAKASMSISDIKFS